MITGPQIRAARKLLNWAPDRLAKHARLAVGVVIQAESDRDAALLPVAAARSIRQTLEGAGVEFGSVSPPLVRLRTDDDGRAN